MNEEYDVVVLGTGLAECVLSGLLSVSGKKVLHTDRNEYYGGESASMNLEGLYKKFKGTLPPEKLGKSNDYNVDLILKLIMADDKLIAKFRCSGVYKYLGFLQIDGSFVYRNGNLYKVPVTEKEVLSSSLLGIFQKRKLRNLLVAIDKCDLDKNEVPKGLTKDSTMSDVYDMYGLSEDNQEFVGHVLALHPNDDYLKWPCLETFKKIRLYKNSLEKYGGSPYLYPMYGLGEIPQGFARKCAVHGGTYMLRTIPTDILFDENGKVCSVRYGDDIVSTKCVIGDPSYFPDRVRKVRQLVRCICILEHPVTAIHPHKSAQIIIPAKQAGRKSDIYVSIISPSFNVSPAGVYIAIVSTVVEGSTPETDVKLGVDLLNPSAISDIDDVWRRVTGNIFDEKMFQDIIKNTEDEDE
ncbi:hypothetical protein MXB_2784 [Myxobolus squamalis]|nr:hypothetical protein MXB_2784 [Myxobolus squamalis]